MGTIVQRGQGTPIVVVPGIQGRWEWMAPTVDALAQYGRVVTYSLCDEPTSRFEWRAERGFENYLDQLDDVVAATGARRVVLVGVSYGGAIALEYAARHPERVAALAIASAPPPTWVPDQRARRYLTAPRLLGAVFWLGGPFRALPELNAAFPDVRERMRFAATQGLRIAGAPPSSGRMARRLRWLQAAQFVVDRALDLPALVVTGEARLERVVPPAQTAEYLRWLPHARVVTLTGTGHAGVVTKSREFASLVGELVADVTAAVARPA